MVNNLFTYSEKRTDFKLLVRANNNRNILFTKSTENLKCDSCYFKP